MRRSREPSLAPAEDAVERPAPGHPRRKWSSALKVVHAMTRFKNMPAKQNEYERFKVLVQTYQDLSTNAAKTEYEHLNVLVRTPMKDEYKRFNE
ncbi:unnamed protein product [Bursaphelenchus okinawaensis]|uniref:Uncharacterized protein n=1 Tax=Bursaphelenchus okinawaensis TaxID=465554 RepID=A0A811KQB3_9BILA|nr:unnamed protein product [Bursaphelenchus okinawaensis]CAG9111264.1 unnamed protein product [Bursaphelenchus okinawaensis]